MTAPVSEEPDDWARPRLTDSGRRRVRAEALQRFLGMDRDRAHHQTESPSGQRHRELMAALDWPSWKAVLWLAIGVSAALVIYYAQL